jgi:hypothetical protein
MKIVKIKVFTLIAVIVFLSAFAVSVSAKTGNPQANPNGQIPEVSGDYAIEGRPDLRVRVFAHEHRNAKGGIPGPNPTNAPTGEPTPTPTGEPTVTPTPGPSVCTDPDSDTVDQATGWKLPASISYTVNESSAPGPIGGDNFKDAVENGFATWTASFSSSTASPVLSYAGTTTKTRKNLDGENIVAFGKTSGSTLGVTYVWYYTATHVVAEVDTIMNDRIPWVFNACIDNAYELNDIMVHEQGHWYGLDDHYTLDFVNNTMYGYGDTAETKKVTPASGDKAGLNLIYQ